MKKFPEARQEFERAIEKNPNLALAYSWCGDCYKEEKKFQQALQLYSKAYEISSNPIYLQEKQKM
jgi:tetratricopeptide (TPR) repeat protein